MKLNLSRKIVATIEATALFSTIFLVVVFYFFLQQTLKDETNAHLSSISQLKGSYVEQNLGFHISEIEGAVKSMHIKSGLTALLERPSKDASSKIMALLLDGMVNRAGLVDLSVINPKGVIVASNNKSEEGKIKSSEQYFLDATKNTTVKSFIYDLTTKQIVTIIATPIKDDAGNFIGVLAEKIDNAEINLLMQDRAGMGATGETYLVNSFNFVTTDLYKEPGSVLKKTVYQPQIVLCLQKKSNYYDSVDYHGDKVFGYARWVPSMESCMVSKFDQSEILGPISQAVPLILLFFVIVSVIILLFGYFVSSSFLKPLQTLKEKTVKIREGDFDVAIEPTSQDEIGDLTLAFKEMSLKLKELYANLETKVKERTQKLEDSERNLIASLETAEKNNKMMIGRELEMVTLKERIKELENKT